MDYHSVHGHDISSFDITGSHRLPTVLASQALDDLQDDTTSYISTGLEELDQALHSRVQSEPENTTCRGGIKRGQITELWGPPGTAKTALSIELAKTSITAGEDVVWIDCFQELYAPRLRDVLATNQLAESGGEERDGNFNVKRGNFIHFSCFTLPHLMALISRPNTKAIPNRVGLIVMSNLSALINSSLPKTTDGGGLGPPKLANGPKPATKRLQGLQFMIKALQKLAATRNCAVLVLSQCATRLQSEYGTTLVAAVNASVWDQGISTRLVLFREWAWKDGQLSSVFMAGLQKVDGKSGQHAIERAVAFRVLKSGIESVEYDSTTGCIPVRLADLVQHKRKLGQTDLEVPDSEDDEDYGWADDDESAMPAPPPQWQGSEDILLGTELRQNDYGRDEDAGSTCTHSSDVTC